MKAMIFVNHEPVPLGEFQETFLCNVVEGIISSLGYDSGNNIYMHINGKKMSIVVDKNCIPLKSDTVQLIIKCTVLGMLSPIEGIPFFDTVDISIKFNEY